MPTEGWNENPTHARQTLRNKTTVHQRVVSTILASSAHGGAASSKILPTPLPRSVSTREDTQLCEPNCNCHLVSDACKEEASSAKSNKWSDLEKCIFLDKFLQYPKNFSKIAAFLLRKNAFDCTRLYYDSKHTIDYKGLLREHQQRRRGVRVCWDVTARAVKAFGGDLDYDPPNNVVWFRLPAKGLSMLTGQGHSSTNLLRKYPPNGNDMADGKASVPRSTESANRHLNFASHEMVANFCVSAKKRLKGRPAQAPPEFEVPREFVSSIRHRDSNHEASSLQFPLQDDEALVVGVPSNRCISQDDPEIMIKDEIPKNSFRISALPHPRKNTQNSDYQEFPLSPNISEQVHDLIWDSVSNINFLATKSSRHSSGSRQSQIWTINEKLIFHQGFVARCKNWAVITGLLPTKTQAQIRQYLKSKKNRLGFHVIQYLGQPSSPLCHWQSDFLDLL